MKVVLASQSPRRKWLLESAGLEVEVEPVAVDETPGPDEPPADLAERLARLKAWAIEREDDEAPIVAADTVVSLRGELLGKPLDNADAARMLRRLSGDEHEVLTGYCVRFRGQERTGSVRTSVWFRSLTDEEIERYLKTGEALDKAGAYGIQGAAGPFVDRLSGSYTNVIGLPLAEVLWEIESLAGPR
jgi:septum formation protein